MELKGKVTLGFKNKEDKKLNITITVKELQKQWQNNGQKMLL